jgi:hypothetical protein
MMIKDRIAQRKQLLYAAVSLLAVQVIHALVPAETTHGEGVVGPVLGGLALVTSVAALIGMILYRQWGQSLLAVTGAGVAGGFLLYHALPIYSPITNPYFDEPKIGMGQWAPVIACIFVGAWCLIAVLVARHPRAPQ